MKTLILKYIYIEDLIATKLINTLPPNVHYRIQKTPPLDHILSQLDSIHAFTPLPF
jgi:hypothetical protein